MVCHNSNVRMTCAIFSKLLSRLTQNFASAGETPSNFELHYAESKKWRTESGYQLFAFVPESCVSCKMCTTPNQRRCRQYASNFEFKYKFFLAQRSKVKAMCKMYTLIQNHIFGRNYKFSLFL